MADYIIPGHMNFVNTYISIEIQPKGSLVLPFMWQGFPYNLLYQISLVSLTSFSKERKQILWNVPRALWKISKLVWKITFRIWFGRSLSKTPKFKNTWSNKIIVHYEVIVIHSNKGIKTLQVNIESCVIIRKMVTMTLYVRQQRRHRCKEQTIGLCGRRRDDLRE